ncbi:hypothetical protein WJX73_008966 [Symbiochloris irregularis]|uniref:Uncharacterized protein n=1 Tax=Symbiochloris irregularis TaxID=706552 RepID=A0AAW1NR02_9CHLO
MSFALSWTAPWLEVYCDLGAVHCPSTHDQIAYNPPVHTSRKLTTDTRLSRQYKQRMQKVKRFFMGDRLDKQRLAALGLGAVASYGFVSNVTYGTGLAVSWIAFVKQFGKGPLMPGQWKAFLGFYAGFWTVQNFLRPLRFSLALAMAPAFDRGILEIQKITKFKRRKAFGVYLFILGSVTSTLIFGSIFLFAGCGVFVTALESLARFCDKFRSLCSFCADSAFETPCGVQ